MTSLAQVCVGGLLAVAVLGVASLPPQAPELPAVLQRVGRYVAEYQQEFSLLIADERYVQEVTRSDVGPNFSSAATERRTLVSEFALVRLEDTDRALWLAFRDVREVDGRPVHDHVERLQRLFVMPHANALAQARAIALESARYNIGALVRTVNIPTIALEFLATSMRKRSRFEKRGEEILQGVNAWAVAFEERRRPTLIQTPEGHDVATRGVAWIDPDNGRVLATRIEPKAPGGVTTCVTVTYLPDERLGLWVPAEMNETYDSESWQISGKARYTTYRRFETDVRLKGPVR